MRLSERLARRAVPCWGTRAGPGVGAQLCGTHYVCPACCYLDHVVKSIDEALREAAKAICTGCRLCLPIAELDDQSGLYHPNVYDCPASGIHALLAERNEPESDT